MPAALTTGQVGYFSRIQPASQLLPSHLSLCSFPSIHAGLVLPACLRLAGHTQPAHLLLNAVWAPRWTIHINEADLDTFAADLFPFLPNLKQQMATTTEETCRSVFLFLMQLVVVAVRAAVEAASEGRSTHPLVHVFSRGQGWKQFQSQIKSFIEAKVRCNNLPCLP